MFTMSTPPRRNFATACQLYLSRVWQYRTFTDPTLAFCWQLQCPHSCPARYVLRNSAKTTVSTFSARMDVTRATRQVAGTASPTVLSLVVLACITAMHSLATLSHTCGRQPLLAWQTVRPWKAAFFLIGGSAIQMCISLSTVRSTSLWALRQDINAIVS